LGKILRTEYQLTLTGVPIVYLFIYLLYGLYYTHVKSFTIVKNPKCEEITYSYP